MTTAKQWRDAENAVKKQMAQRGVDSADRYQEWTRGDLISIQGEVGAYKFLSVRLKEGQPAWVNVWGGPKGAEAFRSFTLDRIQPLGKVRQRRSKKS